MSEKIVNVYEFHSKNTQKSYIYTLKKDGNKLGFDYFILTKNNQEIKIYEAKNEFKNFQNNDIKLIPIKKETEEYKEFLEELLSYNEKKEEVLSRK